MAFVADYLFKDTCAENNFETPNRVSHGSKGQANLLPSMMNTRSLSGAKNCCLLPVLEDSGQSSSPGTQSAGFTGIIWSFSITLLEVGA